MIWTPTMQADFAAQALAKSIADAFDVARALPTIDDRLRFAATLGQLRASFDAVVSWTLTENDRQLERTNS